MRNERRLNYTTEVKKISRVEESVAGVRNTTEGKKNTLWAERFLVAEDFLTLMGLHQFLYGPISKLFWAPL